MSKYVVVTLAFAVLGVCENAEATSFPDVDGSHDIASVTAWGGTIPSEAGFTTTYDDPLVASSNLTFGSVSVSAGAHVVFDLLSTPTRRITVTTAKTTDAGLSFAGADTTADFLGGIWSMNGMMSFATTSMDASILVSNAQVSCSKVNVGGQRNRLVFTGEDTTLVATQTGSYALFSAAMDNELLLTDGASWQHNAGAIYTMVSGKGCTNNVLRVSNKASITSTQSLNVGYSDNELSNRVEILDGGVVSVKSVVVQKNAQALVVSNGTLTTTSAWLSPKGNGTRFSLMGENAKYEFTTLSTLFSSAVNNGVIEISDGAKIDSPAGTGNIYTYNLDGNAITNNTLRIARQGKFLTSRTFNFGYGFLDASNRIEVLDGGVLEAGTIFIGREGTALDIRNGTVSCTAVKFLPDSYTGRAATGCRLSLSGKTAELRQSAMERFLFQSGNVGNGIVISDGAKLRHSDPTYGLYMTLLTNPHDNFVRIERGGELLCDRGFYCGYDTDASNRVEVLNGGVLKASFVRVGGVGGGLIVSNGVVEATNGVMCVGTTFGDNNQLAWLTVAGTNSQLTATDRFELSRLSTLNFIVPEEGYAKTPISVGGDFDILDGTHLTVDAAALQRKLMQRTKVTLAEWKGNDSISAAVLAELNAALSEKKMSVAVEGKTLVLTVRPLNSGLILLFR